MNLAFTILVSFFSFFISPEKNPPTTPISSLQHPAGEKAWKTEYQDDRVLIESSVEVYTGKNNSMMQERIVFRYTNRTSKNLQLSFGRKMIYDAVCYGCDKSDKRFLVDLAPNERKEYSDQNKDKTYYIFAKDLKQTIKRSLDSFEFTNIETLIQ